MAIGRLIQIDRDSSRPIAQQLAEQVESHIHQGRLSFGAKMPSIRELAQDLGINKIGVVTAYERLVDSGHIQSRPGSGFFVCWRGRAQLTKEEPRDADPSPLGASPLLLPHALFKTPLMQEIFGGRGADSFALGSSHPSPDAVPVDELRSAARSVLMEEGLTLSYEEPMGLPALRERLLHELSVKGIPSVGYEQILVTGGALQALQLALRALTRPGDSVLVECPSFALLFPLLKSLSLRPIEMGRSFKGLEPEEITHNKLQGHRPKVLITNPSFHNPTGGFLEAHERHRLLKLAEERSLWILELDHFSHLSFGELTLPPLAALDGLKRTLHIGSWSKNLSPGLRLGFAAGPRGLIDAMTQIKFSAEIASPSLEQRMLLEFLNRGLFKKHALRIRELYRQRRDTLAGMLRRLAPEGSHWDLPEGGMFLWFAFPSGGPLSQTVAETAAEKGISLAPQDVFYPDQRPGPHMRLNYAALEPVRTWRALETTFSIWRALKSRMSQAHLR